MTTFNFRGKVVNQKNLLSIQGAKVSFEGLGNPRYTDVDGIFLFPIDIISGNIINVNIRVEAEGYRPYNRYTDLSIGNQNLEEFRLIENDTENSGKPPVAITVAKIGAVATVVAALIAGGAMLLSGKTPTPQPTSQPSSVSINPTPNISQKPRTRLEIEVYDSSDTKQLLSDVSVQLRPSAGQSILVDKTNISGYLTTSISEQNENMLEVYLSKDNYEPSIEYIDISIQKKHRIYLKKKGITRTSANQNFISTGTPDSNTSTPTSSEKAPLISGYWNIKMKVIDDTYSLKNGRLRMENVLWRTFFKQDNNEFKGYIESANGRVCKGEGETSISGSVKGKKVDWKVEYPGKCCHGGEMVFEGKLVDTNKIEGNIKPNPEKYPEKCTLFWAKVDMLSLER